MRMILSLSVCLLMSGLAAFAASSLDSATIANLRLLEQKYFEHTFESDTDEQRVRRVEELIKGESGTGSPGDRIQKIVSGLIADGQSLAPPVSPGGKADHSTVDSSKSESKSTAPKSKLAGAPPVNSSDDQDDNGDDSTAGQNSDYPHINALEKEILGQTYAGQPLVARLSRMETKAFGAVSQNLDLSQRTDSLEKFAEKKLNAKPFGINPAMPSADFDSDTVPTASAGRAQQQQRQSAPGGLGSAIPRQVIQSLLGIPNFSNMPSAPRTMDEPPVAHQEDPSVYQADAPPSSEPMLVRVGWCEVHAFGHTFPMMHLTQRLRQLNDQVRPNSPKQTDMQLMDDLNSIVAAVQAKQAHPDKVAGARNLVPSIK